MTARRPLPNCDDHITQTVGDLLAGAKFALCGSVSGHDRIKHCLSLPDLIAWHLLVEYCGCDAIHGSRADRRLTPKEQRFVQEYAVDLNGTQAAIRAGYSPKTARSIASETL